MRRARYYYVYLAITLTYNRLPINWGVVPLPLLMPPLEPKTPLTLRIRTKPEVSSSISLARPLVYPHAPDSEGPCATGSGFPNFAEVAHAPTVHVCQLGVSIRRAPDKSPETNFKFQLARGLRLWQVKSQVNPTTQVYKSWS